jgi:YggT family protein
MLTQIALLLLKTAISLWVGLFLFRWYCLFIKLNLSQGVGQFSQFIYKLTDWAVLPMRRVLPKSSRFDLACFISAFLIQLVGILLQSLLVAGHIAPFQSFVLAFFELASSALSGMTGLLIIFALLSWINANAEVYYFLDRLTQPFLAPVRKIIPPIAGVDISILIVLLLLQVVNIVLANLRVLALSFA